MKYTFAEEDVKVARKRYAEERGLRVTSLAAEFGVSPAVMSHALSGVSWSDIDDPAPCRIRGSRVSPDDAAALVPLRGAGLSYRQIAAKTGFSLGTVYSHARDIPRSGVVAPYGVQPRS